MKNDKEKLSTVLVILLFLAYSFATILEIFIIDEKHLLLHIRKIIFLALALYALKSFASLLKALWPFVREFLRKWSVVILTIVITVAIPVVFHFACYREQSITQETLLSAYTQYLSFVGAFALGYFLYKREEVRNDKALKKKARIIYESMFYIWTNLSSIDYFIEREETYPVDENWRSDYLDIKHLVKHDETALSNELQYFFHSVGEINKAIITGDKARAKNIYLKFELKEKYSDVEYNYMDAGEVLMSIFLDIPQQKSWKEKEKKQIEIYAEKFFDIVELWIYNHMIKNNLQSCEAEDIEYDLVEWLLQHPELKSWVGHAYEKRKITAVITRISLYLSKKSCRLDYAWRTYCLRK